MPPSNKDKRVFREESPQLIESPSLPRYGPSLRSSSVPTATDNHQRPGSDPSVPSRRDQRVMAPQTSRVSGRDSERGTCGLSHAASDSFSLSRRPPVNSSARDGSCYYQGYLSSASANFSDAGPTPPTGGRSGQAPRPEPICTHGLRMLPSDSFMMDGGGNSPGVLSAMPTVSDISQSTREGRSYSMGVTPQHSGGCGGGGSRTVSRDGSCSGSYNPGGAEGSSSAGKRYTGAAPNSTTSGGGSKSRGPMPTSETASGLNPLFPPARQPAGSPPGNQGSAQAVHATRSSPLNSPALSSVQQQLPSSSSFRMTNSSSFFRSQNSGSSFRHRRGRRHEADARPAPPPIAPSKTISLLQIIKQLNVPRNMHLPANGLALDSLDPGFAMVLVKKEVEHQRELLTTQRSEKMIEAYKKRLRDGPIETPLPLSQDVLKHLPYALPPTEALDANGDFRAPPYNDLILGYIRSQNADSSSSSDEDEFDYREDALPCVGVSGGGGQGGRRNDDQQHRLSDNERSPVTLNSGGAPTGNSCVSLSFTPSRVNRQGRGFEEALKEQEEQLHPMDAAGVSSSGESNRSVSEANRNRAVPSKEGRSHYGLSRTSSASSMGNHMRDHESGGAAAAPGGAPGPGCTGACSPFLCGEHFHGVGNMGSSAPLQLVGSSASFHSTRQRRPRGSVQGQVVDPSTCTVVPPGSALMPQSSMTTSSSPQTPTLGSRALRKKSSFHLMVQEYILNGAPQMFDRHYNYTPRSKDISDSKNKVSWESVGENATDEQKDNSLP